MPPERADQGTIPLNGPVDGIVAGNDGRGDVEHLRAEAPPGVEDGVVEGTSEGVLAVGSDAVGDDAPLLETACTGRRVGLECGWSLGGLNNHVTQRSSVAVILLCPFPFLPPPTPCPSILHRAGLYWETAPCRCEDVTHQSHPSHQGTYSQVSIGTPGSKN